MTKAERLSVLTTRAMVNGLGSLTESERRERDQLAIKLLYSKDSKGRLTAKKPAVRRKAAGR